MLVLFMHRDAHVISVRETGAWSAVWVALGVAFGGVLWSVAAPRPISSTSPAIGGTAGQRRRLALVDELAQIRQ